MTISGPDGVGRYRFGSRTIGVVAVIRIGALVLATFSIVDVGYGRYLSRFVDLGERESRHTDTGRMYVPARKPVSETIDSAFMTPALVRLLPTSMDTAVLGGRRRYPSVSVRNERDETL